MFRFQYQMFLSKFSPPLHQNFVFIMEIPTSSEVEKLTRKIYKSVKSNSKRYISPSVLRGIYRQFREYRRLMKKRQTYDGKDSEFQVKNINAFECDILKYLLERCYWIRYGDGEMVAYLLCATYDIVNNLGKIFDYRDSTKFWVFGRNCKIDGKFQVKSTWVQSNFNDEEIKPVDYFIFHSNRKKLLFGGQRFAEQYFLSSRIAAQVETQSCLYLPPCSLSFQHPELLPKLLRYGLFVKATSRNADVAKLLTGIISVFINYPNRDSGPCGDFALEYVDYIQKMGNCLLRAIESVNILLLMKSQKRSNNEVALWLMELSDSGRMPTLLRRCGGPQELMHLCRRKIRLLLYNQWMLPDGIHTLPLPNLMKSYLNLEID